MSKIHFDVEPSVGRIACGRSAQRSSDVPSNVTCLACQATPEFNRAKYEANVAAKIAFDALIPRTFAEPWKQGNLVCGFNPTGTTPCSSDLFRYAGRSCHGHYDDYVCAACGHTTSRLTETGMSF